MITPLRPVTRAIVALLTLAPTLALAQVSSKPAPPPPQPPPAPATAQPAPKNPALKPITARAAAPVTTSKRPWWEETIFYEVFVRSFADSDSGPLASDGVGDIQGLIDNLDYLNDGKLAQDSNALGVTGLWLMPINPSPSYHGYDVTDYYGINPQYGTIEDFRRLMTEAHKRNIKVIIDLVPNHTSDKHPWFLEAIDPKSPRHDWYLWSAADSGWTNWANQHVWHRLSGGDTPTPFYYGLFSPRMPDLNFRNPGPTKAMHEIAEFWLGKPERGMGVDGFRLDAIRHLIEDGKVWENTPETHTWLREFEAACKKANPSAITVGEVWSPTNIVASYTPDQLDLAFEFDLAGAMITAARTGDPAGLRTTMQTVLGAYPPNQFATFLSNHDQARVMTQVGNRLDAAKCAATLLLTSPGVPFIYYGEELGMTGDKPDENIRTPMQWNKQPNAGFSTGTPWRAVNDKFETVNVEVQASDGASLYNHYRRLCRVRQRNPALTRGTYFPLIGDAPAVYAFLRTAEVPLPDGRGTFTEGAVVVVNLGDEPVTNYGLSIPASPLRGQIAGELELGRGIFTAPKIDRDGGFSAYRPVLTLRPRTGYVIRLSRL